MALAILAVVAVLAAVGVVVFLFLQPPKHSIAGAPVGVRAPLPTTTFSPAPPSTSDSSTTPPESSSTPTTAPADPATVVQNFYAAINGGDYQTAWDLGGRNLSRSYTSFASGFANTVHDDLTITGTNGNVVSVVVVAQESDGRAHTYTGSYTVEDGVIQRGTLR